MVTITLDRTDTSHPFPPEQVVNTMLATVDKWLRDNGLVNPDDTIKLTPKWDDRHQCWTAELYIPESRETSLSQSQVLREIDLTKEHHVSHEKRKIKFNLFGDSSTTFQDSQDYINRMQCLLDATYQLLGIEESPELQGLFKEFKEKIKKYKFDIHDVEHRKQLLKLQQKFIKSLAKYASIISNKEITKKDIIKQEKKTISTKPRDIVCNLFQSANGNYIHDFAVPLSDISSALRDGTGRVTPNLWDVTTSVMDRNGKRLSITYNHRSASRRPNHMKSTWKDFLWPEIKRRKFARHVVAKEITSEAIQRIKALGNSEAEINDKSIEEALTVKKASVTLLSPVYNKPSAFWQREFWQNKRGFIPTDKRYFTEGSIGIGKYNIKLPMHLSIPYNIFRLLVVFSTSPLIQTLNLLSLITSAKEVHSENELLQLLSTRQAFTDVTDDDLLVTEGMLKDLKDHIIEPRYQEITKLLHGRKISFSYICHNKSVNAQRGYDSTGTDRSNRLDAARQIGIEIAEKFNPPIKDEILNHLAGDVIDWEASKKQIKNLIGNEDKKLAYVYLKFMDLYHKDRTTGDDLKDNYLESVLFAQLATELGYKVHITCKSGEDRTGTFNSVWKSFISNLAIADVDELDQKWEDFREKVWLDFHDHIAFSEGLYVTESNAPGSRGYQSQEGMVPKVQFTINSMNNDDDLIQDKNIAHVYVTQSKIRVKNPRGEGILVFDIPQEIKDKITANHSQLNEDISRDISSFLSDRLYFDASASNDTAKTAKKVAKRPKKAKSLVKYIGLTNSLESELAKLHIVDPDAKDINQAKTSLRKKLSDVVENFNNASITNPQSSIPAFNLGSAQDSDSSRSELSGSKEVKLEQVGDMIKQLFATEDLSGLFMNKPQVSHESDQVVVKYQEKSPISMSKHGQGFKIASDGQGLSDDQIRGMVALAKVTGDTVTINGFKPKELKVLLREMELQGVTGEIKSGSKQAKVLTRDLKQLYNKIKPKQGDPGRLRV